MAETKDEDNSGPHTRTRKNKAALLARRKEAERQRALISKDVKQESKQALKKEIKQELKKEEPKEPELPKRKRIPRRRRTLRQLLDLAGMEEEPQALVKRLFMLAVFITLGLTGLSMVVEFVIDHSLRTAAGLLEYAGFLLALWTIGFLGVCIFIGIAFAVYLDLRINSRRKQIEAVLPDYLQLAAANLSAGMTIDRALWHAVRPRFGVLANEIEDVAKKTMTGYELERALQDFGEKYDSTVLRRSLNLIIEGIHSGGRLADILNKIAINIQENAILQKEMAANVTTYVIFISFATIVASPFLFALANQLLLVIQSIAGSVASQGGGSVGITISGDVVSRSDFSLYTKIVLSASALMSAAIVAVIRKGSVKDGIRLIPFFVAVSLVLFAIASWFLHFLFADLV